MRAQHASFYPFCRLSADVFEDQGFCAGLPLSTQLLFQKYTALQQAAGAAPLQAAAAGPACPVLPAWLAVPVAALPPRKVGVLLAAWEMRAILSSSNVIEVRHQGRAVLREHLGGGCSLAAAGAAGAEAGAAGAAAAGAAAGAAGAAAAGTAAAAAVARGLAAPLCTALLVAFISLRSVLCCADHATWQRPLWRRAGRVACSAGGRRRCASAPLPSRGHSGIPAGHGQSCRFYQDPGTCRRDLCRTPSGYRGHGCPEGCWPAAANRYAWSRVYMDGRVAQV